MIPRDFLLYNLGPRNVTTSSSLILKVHASETENFLVGKKLDDEAVVQSALKLLANEFKESTLPGESAFEYRQKLAQGLLYKVIANEIYLYI
jgi:xanthine dehydrogenase iron-sulfur cluster and FAD-binding subunit A